MYLCIYVFMYLCIYVFMYLCIYVFNIITKIFNWLFNIFYFFLS